MLSKPIISVIEGKPVIILDSCKLENGGEFLQVIECRLNETTGQVEFVDSPSKVVCYYLEQNTEIKPEQFPVVETQNDIKEEVK